MRIIVLTIFVVAICSGIGFGTGHYLIGGKKWVGITVGGAFGIGVVAGYAAAMQHPFINASECFTTPPQAVLAQPPPAGRGKLLQANAQQSAAADAVGVTITDDDDDDGLAVDDPNLARAVSCGDGGLGQLFGAPKDEVDKVAVGWTPNIPVLDMRTAALRSSLRGTTLTAAQWEQRECSRGPLSPRSTGDSPTPKGWPPRRAPPQALSPGRESRAAQPYLGVPRSTLSPRSPRKEKDTHSCNEEGLKPGVGSSQSRMQACSVSFPRHSPPSRRAGSLPKVPHNLGVEQQSQSATSPSFPPPPQRLPKRQQTLLTPLQVHATSATVSHAEPVAKGSAAVAAASAAAGLHFAAAAAALRQEASQEAETAMLRRRERLVRASAGNARRRESEPNYESQV